MASVSVIIPLYNKSAFVARAIDSVLGQSFQDFEIVVIDDGSTDDGPAKVRGYADPRIRLLTQANAGPGAARNKGVREASSALVAFLDADDEYLPAFLELSIENLRKNPDCVLSASNHFRGAEKILATDVFPFNIGIEAGPWRLPPDSPPEILWGSLIFMQTWVTVCRREALLEQGGFYEHHCTYGEDQYLWLRLLLNKRVYRDLRPLFWYHSENSELEMWSRASTTPIWPFLTDPEPLRQSCPPAYREALEGMLRYAASLNYSYIVSDGSKLSFWKEYLRGIPEAHDLPLDRPRPRERSFRTGSRRIDLDADLCARIRAACAAYSISPRDFFLSSLAFLAWKCTSQETVVIGMPYESRDREETQGLFGCYMRTIPVRIDFDETRELSDWLGYVKAQAAAAWANSAIGTEELVDASGVSRPENMDPICQIAFALSEGGRSGAAEFAESFAERGLLGYDLALYMTGEHCFEAQLEYSLDILDAESVDMLADNFLRVAKALSVGFKDSLGDIGVMDASGMELVERANATERADFLGRSFLELFRDSVKACGQSAAVKSTDDGSILSYAELDALSDLVARRLAAAGATEGSIVGLYMPRNRWLLPSIIGAFKAGCAYSPLNPDFPRDRNAGIVEDAGIRLILAPAALAAEASALGGSARIVEADGASSPPAAALPPPDPKRTAYVLFTSGSTGKPKGVPISHESLANLLLSMLEEPGLPRDAVVLGLTTFTFDISTLEFFLPLIGGALLVLADGTISLDDARLAKLVEDEGVNFVQATPSRWTMLLEAGFRGRPGMTLLTGGEGLPPSLARSLAETGARVWNVYGPTETTVWSSKSLVSALDAVPGIGKPISNTGFFVLDKSGRLLPPGIPGELGISGAGLSAGYLNRPDLSSGRFVDIDVGACGSSSRVYKTGDLVQQRPAGDFRCFGRNDFQVKIRGFRIELGEIESAMQEFPGVKEAACKVWSRTELDKRIVAYYRQDSPVDLGELKERLKKSLPEYMIPGHFVALAEFPRTSSGKTDRKALPLPDSGPEPAAAGSGTASASGGGASPIEARMHAIWREVLGVDSFGIDESFFDLGGHSVLAVDLIRKLNAKLGGDWKLRDLFETPTVRALAGVMDAKRRTKLPLLFTLSKKGGRTPFFIVPGVYSNKYYEDPSFSQYEQDFLRYFNNLLVVLGNDRPVYGLRPQGIYRGEKFRLSVEGMASEYVKEIKAVQPQGPYLIGGECIGGVVAHAIASALRDGGDEVSKLVLLDTYRIHTAHELTMRSQDFLRDLRAVLEGLRDAVLHAQLNRKALMRAVDWAGTWLFPLGQHSREKRRLELGTRTYTNLLLRYRPKRYEGKTLLIVNEAWNAKHSSLSWNSELCPSLDIRIVPGDHVTRLTERNETFERCLKEELD
jgi:amino acid adenylation domain-containing protein